MNIIIYGTGNVAHVLGKLIINSKHHHVIGVSARNETPGNSLADILGTKFISTNDLQNHETELTIITVSDNALTGFDFPQGMNCGLLVHTAGAVSKEVLKKYSNRYGVLYPLQSMRKELNHLPEIPFLIDGVNDEETNILAQFCTSLNCISEKANDEQRLAMHTAAVVVSNFTNHLYALAEKFCHNRNINFNMLKPLIVETASRLEYASPAEMQTGPAIRKDLATIERHLSILDEHPKLKVLYDQLTKSILGTD